MPNPVIAATFSASSSATTSSIPGIGPAQLGLRGTQRIKQPAGLGQLAILLHRGHTPILPAATDNFGRCGTERERNAGMR